MFKIFVLVMWAVFTAGTASARIGWTLEQCRERYGPETPCIPALAELTDLFTVGKVRLGIHFAADGKADSIIYTRDRSEGEFTELERKALMDRNCGELSWEHFAPWFKNEYWTATAPPYSQTTTFVVVKISSDNYYGLWVHTRQFDIDRQKAEDQAVGKAATTKLQGL